VLGYAPVSGRRPAPMADGELLRAARPAPDGEVALICLPHAGGAASGFWQLWSALPEWIEAWAAELPGHGERLLEPPITDIGALADAISVAAAARIALPIALLGDCFGALLAYEVARRLQSMGCSPVLLFVLSFSPPDDQPLREPCHLWPDAQFLAHLARLGGTPPEVLGDEEMMELFLPSLRSDFSMLNRYNPGSVDRLDFPISVVHTVTEDENVLLLMGGWSRLTTFEVSMHGLDASRTTLATDKHLPKLVACLLRKRLARRLNPSA
jgi:surfactin synthase thioesterase subunit